MRLKTLRIRNFRSFGRVELQIGAMHALVGANNAGKSTVLHALDFFFNPSTKKINEESFFQNDTGRRIEVEGVFHELTDWETEQLEPYLRPDGEFQMMRTASMAEGASDESDGDGKVRILAHYCKPQPKLDWLNTARIEGATIKEWWKDKDNLVVGGHSFAAIFEGGAMPKVGDWKERASKFAAEHLAEGDWEDAWVPNPQGYAGVLKGSIPHFELIPAVRDASDESRVTKTSPFGRLIYEIVNSLDAGLKAELEGMLHETTRRLNRAGAEQRIQRVREIESTIREFLTEVMPADLELEFQAPTIELLLTTPKIFIDDGFKGSIEGKGHGMQRAVIFAILRAYAHLVSAREAKARKTLILGIEEPELYMHPTAQRTVRKVLRRIANGGDQVLFSTHSPLLVDVAFFDEIIRLEAADPKAEMGTPSSSVRAHQLPMAAMIEDLVARFPKLRGTVTPEAMRDRYSHVYTPTRNEGFFARKVVLVEGLTELYALPIFAAALGDQFDFDSAGIAVVECGGKGQMDRLYRIFNELGVVTYLLFDYDKGNKDPAVRRDSKVLLTLLGRSDIEDPEATVVTDRFSCFSINWESNLKEEIPEWVSLKAEAKEQLGLSDESKPLIARYVARKLTEAESPRVPRTIQGIIERIIGSEHAGSCLRSTEQEGP